MKTGKGIGRLVATALMTAVALTAFASVGGNAFGRLDSLIAAQPRIVADKETRLARMKVGLAAEAAERGRYEVMRQLYEEYAAYQYDSAYAYVSGCIRLAEEMRRG